jgi:multidrug efflux pump
VGPSAASQNAIGTGVLGGMISATILAIIFVPAFFVFVLGVLKTKRPEHTQGEDSVARPASHAATSEPEYPPGATGLP